MFEFEQQLHFAFASSFLHSLLEMQGLKSVFVLFLYLVCAFIGLNSVLCYVQGASVEHIDEVYGQKWIRRIDFRRSRVHQGGKLDDVLTVT